MKERVEKYLGVSAEGQGWVWLSQTLCGMEAALEPPGTIYRDV